MIGIVYPLCFEWTFSQERLWLRLSTAVDQWPSLSIARVKQIIQFETRGWSWHSKPTRMRGGKTGTLKKTHNADRVNLDRVCHYEISVHCRIEMRTFKGQVVFSVAEGIQTQWKTEHMTSLLVTLYFRFNFADDPNVNPGFRLTFPEPCYMAMLRPTRGAVTLYKVHEWNVVTARS